MATADSTRLGLGGSRLIAAARRVAALARGIPLALAVVIGVGLALRILTWVAINPAVMNNVDSTIYVLMADGHMFTDAARPAGYSMFMELVHFVSADLDLTIAVQHLIGIATALLLYATVRRVGAPVWAGVIAAAAVLLSLDQIYLEHTLLAEAPFSLFLALALYASVRALEDPREFAGWGGMTTRHIWIVAAGVTLGLSAWMRGVAAPMVFFLAIWFALALPGRWWVRLGRASLAAAAAGAVLLVYFQANLSATGHFGLTRSTGWGLYVRVAPFADCTEFEPPAGTAALCEDRPPNERPGSDFYAWNQRSPAQEAFGPPPAGNDSLRAFAREVITHQPLNYGLVVFRDTMRYFAQDIDIDVPTGGTPYYWMAIGRRDENEADIQSKVDSYYTPETLSVDRSLAATLTDAQALLRVQPALLLIATILGAAGIWLSRGRVRASLALLLGAGLLLLIIPSATASWNARYAVPADGPLVAAGAVGVWVIFRYLLDRRQPDQSYPGTTTPA
jgi:4-amino-4-deoxy-L-arabinose transferase-like glycosyltransferase